MGGCGDGVGGIPSDYLVSTQLQLWLFWCWGCGCCWAVTIKEENLWVKLTLYFRNCILHFAFCSENETFEHILHNSFYGSSLWDYGISTPNRSLSFTRRAM